MYHASCTVYYPGHQMHNIYINNILYIISISACISASASSLGGVLSLYFAKVTKLLKLQLSKISRLKCSHDNY